MGYLVGNSQRMYILFNLRKLLHFPLRLESIGNNVFETGILKKQKFIICRIWIIIYISNFNDWTHGLLVIFLPMNLIFCIPWHDMLQNFIHIIYYHSWKVKHQLTKYVLKQIGNQFLSKYKVFSFRAKIINQMNFSNADYSILFSFLSYAWNYYIF